MKALVCLALCCCVISHVSGYAKLGDTMKCANGDCSETISEGKAKLAYQPRDKKFLNLKKGEVVLVKGKKAGDKTDLWGGQIFLGQSSNEEEISNWATRDQKIVIERQKHQEIKEKKEDASNAQKSEDANENHESNVEVAQQNKDNEFTGNQVHADLKQEGTHLQPEETSPEYTEKYEDKTRIGDENGAPSSDDNSDPPSVESDDLKQTKDDKHRSADGASGSEASKDNSSSELLDEKVTTENQEETLPSNQVSEEEKTTQYADDDDDDASKQHDLNEDTDKDNEFTARDEDSEMETKDDDTISDNVASTNSPASDVQDEIQEAKANHEDVDKSASKRDTNDAIFVDEDKDDSETTDKEKVTDPLDIKNTENVNTSNEASLFDEKSDSSGHGKGKSETTDSVDTDVGNEEDTAKDEENATEALKNLTESSADFKEDAKQLETSSSSTTSEENKDSDLEKTTSDLNSTENQSYLEKTEDQLEAKELSGVGGSSEALKNENDSSIASTTVQEGNAATAEVTSSQQVSSDDDNNLINHLKDNKSVEDANLNENFQQESNLEEVSGKESSSVEKKDVSDVDLRDEEPPESRSLGSDENRNPDVSSADSATPENDNVNEGSGKDVKIDVPGAADETRDKDCIVDSSKRVACGAQHSSKVLCDALDCCWSLNKDPSVSNCYYSNSQVELARQRNAEESMADMDREDGVPPTIVSHGNSYQSLHEGKNIGWDEAVVDKKEDKSSWDEAIGSEVGVSNETTTEQEIDRTQDNSTTTTTGVDEGNEEKGVVGKEEQDGKTEDLVTESVVRKEFTEENTSANINDSEMLTSSSLKQKEKGIEEQQLVEPSTDTSASDDSTTTSQGEIEQKTDEEIASQPVVENIDSSSEKYQVDDELDHAESFILNVLSLIGQLPSDIIYILTPLGVWFLALLPEEYQQDVYGFSWSTIIFTVVVGLIVIWFLIWRSSVKKQNNRERELVMTSRELKAQMEAMMEEKLKKEEELKDAQQQLETAHADIHEQNASKSQTQNKLNRLEEEAKNLQVENEAKQKEIVKYDTTLKELEKEKNILLNKSKQTEKNLDEKKSAFSDVEKTLVQVRKELKESQKHKKRLEESVNNYQLQLNKEEKNQEETGRRLRGWEQQAEEMKDQIKTLEGKINEVTNEHQTTRQEADVLKDCLLQFRGVQEALMEDGDEDLDEDELADKQKEKLKGLIEVARIQRKMKLLETEKNQIIFELEAEKKSRENTEAQIGELEAECENERVLKSKAERDLQVHQAKLNVMQEFYAKREVEMQGKLGKEQNVREMHESKLVEQGGQTQELLESLDLYKKMNAEAKEAYEESEKQRKNEVKKYEQKIHQNWLGSRDAERKLDEANREINQLRMDLTDLKERLRSAEHREPFLIRPRPIPPGGPFGPRHDRFSNRSPGPMRNGPIPRDMSPPRDRSMGGRRSPSGSVHDDMRRPDRPPSHAYSDRPPSQGPPSNFGDGPRMFGPNSLRNGPPPLHESIPRMAGTPPVRDVPPYMHEGPPPERQGPPILHNGMPIRYGLPSMDGGPPLDVGPPGMFDGSMLHRPPLRGGPPSMMFDGPQRMQRPGSSQGPLTSSPYMERPMVPPPTSHPPPNRHPAPPRGNPMSLHGNLPAGANRSGYDLHPNRGGGLP